METKEQWRGRNDSESECEIKNPFQNFNLFNYLIDEVLQSTRRRQEGTNAQEQCSGTFRNRVYKFLSIPQYFESFMAYGLLQCLDHILLVYTFLPLRCVATIFSLFLFIIRSIIGIVLPRLRPNSRCRLYVTDARDMVKFSFVCLCTIFLYTFDSSIAYHEIRTQSIIKIYIFFNLLEVADRLLSAVYLDAIDDVLFTVSAGLTGKQHSTTETDNKEDSGSATLGSFLLQYLFALLCLFAHCLLLLAQVTTLNVAFNSQNRSLLTVMISNNFVELKSNVFRKMGKSNLFQIACADVRERFHYIVWLFIILCRNMSATGWQWDDFLLLLPDIIFIFMAEVAVDWVKHAFISKFNVISPDVYEEYTVSIAYDLLLCRQGKNASDYFELLARRMGLTPISLSCLINVMIIQTVRSSWIFVFIVIAIPMMFLVKILAHLVLLKCAYAHVNAYTTLMTSKMATVANGSKGAGEVTKSIDTIAHANNKPRNSIFQPYTGYDLPTRDEGQLAMPQAIHRRAHSDSFCLVVPFVGKDGDLRVHNSSCLSDKSSSLQLLDADEFASMCSNTSAPVSPIIGFEAGKRSAVKVILRKDGFFGGEPLNIEDIGDMEIRQRKHTLLPPSLSAGSSKTSILESVVPTLAQNSQFSFYHPSIPPPSYNSVLLPLDDLRLPHLFLPDPQFSRSGQNRSQSPIHLRRCHSLETRSIMTNDASPEPPLAMTNLKEQLPVIGRRTSALRRRIHTENEVSSILILEQLSSILNDESAMLDGDEFDDLYDSEGEKREDNKAVGVIEDEICDPNSVDTTKEISETIGSDIKQPLSNVDRYSMLGGQIN